MHETLHERKRPRPERALRPFRRAKQIGDEGERRAGDVGEEKRRPSGSDHTSMDLSGLETRIDWRVDRDQLAVAAEIGRGTRAGQETTRESRTSGAGRGALSELDDDVVLGFA